MKRPEVLDTARVAVTVDREADHGRPEMTFDLIARLWSVYMDRTFNPVDVAMLLALLKVARQRNNPSHEDNYVDLAGYAACAAELAETWWERTENEPMPDEWHQENAQKEEVGIAYENADLTPTIIEVLRRVDEVEANLDQHRVKQHPPRAAGSPSVKPGGIR